MPAPLLALEQISKRFGAIVVAERLDLYLGQGEALGIIGPNGAGKTTLFGVISGTIAPDSGRVLYAGRDITGLSPAQRCALGIGRSFQIPQPFSGMSVFENLVVAAAFGGGRRERDAYESCMGDPYALRSCRQSQSAGRHAHLARPQAARIGARFGLGARRAVARRGCRRADRTRMPSADRADCRDQAKRRVDCLDRACRACPARQHRSAACSA